MVSGYYHVGVRFGSAKILIKLALISSMKTNSRRKTNLLHQRRGKKGNTNTEQTARGHWRKFRKVFNLVP